MRRSLMDILCCRYVRGACTQVEKENETEILEGELLCTVCEVEYPIRGHSESSPPDNQIK